MNRGNMRGGGFAIALGTVGGFLAGNAYGQPSAGLLGGFALGTLLAIGLWVADRR